MKRLLQILIVLLTIALAASSFAIEFSADTISQLATGSVKGKVFFKSPDVFRNEMPGMVIIVDRPRAYQLFANTKKYHLSNTDEMKKKNPMAGIGDFKTWVKKNNLKRIGKESIEDYSCEIYEGAIKTDGSQNPIHMKLWYSKKLNYPVKTEIILPPPMGTMTTSLENITTGDLPKSLFTIPADYAKAGSIQEAMGMPDMGSFLKKGGTENHIPSQKEREEMMNKIQEMMKQMQQK